jgi:ParB-like chromosome segregation protein Spo0J
MEHARELLSVPLSALVASPYNVRRYTNGQIEELAALIDSQGLLHNLVVTEQVTTKGKRVGQVRFAVAAGERRRRAMLLLQSRGRLASDHEVPCELVPPERALEVSVAENSGREPLLGRVFEASCLSFTGQGETSLYRRSSLAAGQGQLALARGGRPAWASIAAITAGPADRPLC